MAYFKRAEFWHRTGSWSASLCHQKEEIQMDVPEGASRSAVESQESHLASLAQELSELLARFACALADLQKNNSGSSLPELPDPSQNLDESRIPEKERIPVYHLYLA